MGFRLVTTVGMATRDPKVLAELAQAFLRGVILNNQLTIREAKRRGKPIPLLYESGVEYDREPWAGKFEEFADILTVLRRGWGDCDDLAAWRVAELREIGEPRLGLPPEEKADTRIYWRGKCRFHRPHVNLRCAGCLKTQLTMHVQVRRADGRIEDPSRLLGL